jgi:hypothetical protein|tara:strand:+ start:654 stop:965 length:312 start_codon:yes stop_codon:yes gene_type:complete
MGFYKNGLTLVAGMTLYDVDTKSIGILVRRFSTRETQFYEGAEHYSIPYDLVWDMEQYITWVWDSVWSKDGRVVYSETGLLNLIKAGIIVVVDDISSDKLGAI